ncbi:hypothetical protein Adi01nite_00110 [Amorphoplanes digitatis]|nr:hypothetical protein Adi01nite_00110 [Actinoplanes digitatis]
MARTWRPIAVEVGVIAVRRNVSASRPARAASGATGRRRMRMSASRVLAVTVLPTGQATVSPAPDCTCSVPTRKLAWPPPAVATHRKSYGGQSASMPIVLVTASIVSSPAVAKRCS